MSIYYAALQNFIASSELGLGSNTEIYARWPITFGSGDWSDLRFSDVGWFRGTSNTANASNTLTVVAMALEDGVTSVPVTKGASRTWDITAGMNDSQGDVILPSAFGYSKFTRGTTLWLKIRFSVATASLKMMSMDARDYHSLTGSQAYCVVPATAGTISSVDALGAFTISGTKVTVNSTYCPIALGTPIGTPAPIVFGAGDSIMAGSTDDTSNPYGYGFFMRALYDTGAANRILAGCNWARSGTSGSNFNSATSDRCAYWSKYATYAVEEHGTNDFASTGTLITAAQMLTVAQATWTKFKGYGVQKIIRTKLMVRTNSSNSFIDEAGQTAQGVGWDTGGNIQIFNASLAGQITAGNIDAVINMNAARGTDVTKWVTNGATFWSTGDGLHPNSPIHPLLATDLRTGIDNLYTSIDTLDTNISYGQTGNITTSNLGTLTYVSIDAVNAATVAAPGGDGTYTMPARINGAVVPSIGNAKIVIAGDGTKTAASTINVTAPTGEDYVTVASPVATDTSYLHYYFTLSNGDQVGFNTPTTQGVANNRVNANSQIVTDFIGSQTMWIRRASSGIITQATVTKAAGGAISVILGGAVAGGTGKTNLLTGYALGAASL